MVQVKRAKLSLSKRICLTAAFTALCCAATLIAVPLPIGYFNLGDIFVLLSAWILGPVYGVIAASLGSAAADLLSGYALYAPATLLIKGAVALSASLLYSLLKRLIKNEKLDILPRAFAAIVAEAVMVLGYFFFESVILGYGMGATASVLGNSLQATAGVVGGVLLTALLRLNARTKNLFPLL